MIGTRASRAALKYDAGIENGGAESVEPANGGGRVSGSLLGGNWKMEESGRLRWRADILQGACGGEQSGVELGR